MNKADTLDTSTESSPPTSIMIMSLPGLQISTTVEVVAAPVIHDLNEGTEWRFEVAFGSSVHVKVRLLYLSSCSTETANNFNR